MATYWDTSCVVKLYCRESDSEWYLEALAAEAEPLRSSRLLEAELFFAFQMKWARGETGSESPEDLFGHFLEDVEHGRFLLFPLGRDVIDESRKVARTCFASQPTVPLRTLDALHLATARIAKCGRVFSTDVRMRKAAAVLGFSPTENPT